MKKTASKKPSKPKIQNVGIAGLKRKLAAFEKKYQMPTDVFLRKVDSGELDENVDFIRWLGLAEIHQLIKPEGLNDNREVFP
jgi:hypothetical protein